MKPLIQSFINKNLKIRREEFEFLKPYVNKIVIHQVGIIKTVQAFYWIAFPLFCYSEITLYIKS